MACFQVPLTEEKVGDKEKCAQPLGHWFSPPCWEEMPMKTIGFFFLFLKKNKELSEMKLEGKSKENKRGKAM